MADTMTIASPTELTPEPAGDGQPEPETVDALMRAARNFAAVTAESLAQAGDVTLAQFRVLVLASRRPTLNTTAVAAALQVHLSNASRICDRLVAAGLLDRRESRADRRHVQLSLTPRGTELVTLVLEHRRAALVQVLQRMPQDTRAALAAALEVFSDAAEAVGTEGPTSC